MAGRPYYYALRHPPRPTRPELWGQGRRGLPAGRRTGAATARSRCAWWAEEGARIADRDGAQDDAQDRSPAASAPRPTTTGTTPGKGVVREDLRERAGARFAADGPWEKMARTSRSSGSPGEGVLSRRRSTSAAADGGAVHVWHPDMAQQHELLDMLLPKVPEGKNPIMHSDMGWQYQHEGVHRPARRRGSSRACPERATASTTGDGADVRPHEGRVLPRAWPDFEAQGADSRTPWSIGTRGGARLN